MRRTQTTILDPAVTQSAVGSRRIYLALALSCSVVLAGQAADWHQEAGYRWIDLPVPVGAKSGFAPVPARETSVGFTNSLSELAGAANRVLYNGAGVAAGDVNGDGLPDLFFCDLSGTNRLFVNLSGWRFRDDTAAAGLDRVIPSTRGAVFADVDGDGALDLLLTVTGRGVLCFRNDGKGRFTERTSEAGTASNLGSTSLALADVDGNGTLDLYVANYRGEDIRDRGRVKMSMLQGRPVLPGSETNRFVMINGRLEETGQGDQLFLNDGAGRFRLVPWNDGTFADERGQRLAEAPPDWGLTATFRDVNDDRAPDLYVCNDYWTVDRFWINDGRGKFRPIAPHAVRKIPSSSMSVDFADLDRDGHLDFFVVDMLARDPRMRKRQMLAQRPEVSPLGAVDDRLQVVRNTLFRNNGDSTFAEIACYAGLEATDWSWSPNFVDVDLDGYEDLLVGAGHFRDVQDMDAEQQIQARQHSWEQFRDDKARQAAFTQELLEHYRIYPLLRMPIYAFRNLGNWTFPEMTSAWGLAEPGVHQGLAFADLDGDGDLDLAVNNLNGPAALYRNVSGAGRVFVRLKGKPGNTQGVGAKLTLLAGALPSQTTEVVCGGRYQSSWDTGVAFAFPSDVATGRLEVRWRGGGLSVIEGIRPNRAYVIDEASATGLPRKDGSPSKAVFEDVSQALGHRHAETAYDDYARQPLLPFKLSQCGPGVGWADLNGDGRQDLAVGAGQGSAPAVFLQDGAGKFRACPVAEEAAAACDVGGLVAYGSDSNHVTLLAARTGYEAKASSGAFALQFASGRMSALGPVAVEMPGAGALALGDMQGDGRLRLFAAGGVSPGQYPRASASGLYQWEGQRWVADARNTGQFDNLGIINSAVWSDLNGDGLPELVLACEWGPIRVFRNQGGRLFEVTDAWGLARHTGWWRGVTTGDLNHDGRLDIVAANWGLNSVYRASEAEPLVFFHGQLAQPGVMDVVETEYVSGKLAPRRQLAALAQSLPFILEHFSTYRAFSEATVEALLGERLPLASRIQVNTLASGVFLNRGDKFEFTPMPREAQWAPAFSVNVADFDGDGNEDVFLSQNFFAVQPETTRVDAGRGLWLRGDGRGGLAAVPGDVSGVKAYGEQRGAALADFDEDGRIDLALGQNGAATKLYHNVGARPGLRVKLAGPPGNLAAFGAAMRLRFVDHEGPIREIHGGSGYWSQDSSVQVLATPTAPESLWVRWPGGKVTSTPVPSGTRELVVDTEGKLVGRR